MKYMTYPRLLLFAVLALVLAGCSDDPTGGNSSGLRVVVEGLPEGVAAAVTVTGPNAFSRSLTATEELPDLPAGSYLIAAAGVTSGGTTYGALAPSQTVAVSGSGLATATVEYVNSASGLNLAISGQPPGSVPIVRVTGPGGFAKEVTGAALVPALAPGTYAVSAQGVVAGDSTYQASPAYQEVAVTASGTAQVDLRYSAVAQRALNLRVEAAYLVQAAQTRDGAVPLVADREAFVRVFAVSSQANSATPFVRVRLFHGPDEVAVLNLPPQSGSVISTVDQSKLTTSWNLRVPGELLQPGLRMLAEIDPGNAVVEASEGDNTFPASGTPQSITVHQVPPFRLTVVPIHQSVNGRTGRVSARNLEDFVSLTRKLHPVAEVDLELHETYTTTEAALDPEGDVWAIVVTELEAVRMAEAGDPTYYYGVVNPPYGGGVVGIANSIPSRTALGWDRFPDAPETMAHELGHNFGRYHAPCGRAGGADADYPHTLGLIGVYGMDVPAGEIKPPSAFSDIMGYCDVAQWVSDYTFRNVLQYRLANDASPAPSTSESSLLVWGRIDRDGIVLEPAFAIEAPGAVPRAGGPYRLEGLDAAGAQLFSYSFTPSRVTHGPPDARNFAFRVPAGGDLAERLASIRVSGEGRSATMAALAADPSPVRGPVQPFERAGARRVDGETVAIDWDAGRYRMVMVRDPRSGRILSFARGGAARVTSSASSLELSYSDGVRSATQRVRLER